MGERLVIGDVSSIHGRSSAEIIGGQVQDQRYIVCGLPDAIISSVASTDDKHIIDKYTAIGKSVDRRTLSSLGPSSTVRTRPVFSTSITLRRSR